jgi:hypothetical protein
MASALFLSIHFSLADARGHDIGTSPKKFPKFTVGVAKATNPHHFSNFLNGTRHFSIALILTSDTFRDANSRALND